MGDVPSRAGDVEGVESLRVTIAEAGMAGPYLYRLLKDAGEETDLHSTVERTGYGHRPCAPGNSPGR